MNVLSIDPGTTESAWLVYDTNERRVLESAKWSNGEIIQMFRAGYRSADRAVSLEPPKTDERLIVDVLAIEMIASYGMAVGAEVFETCTWIGRFEESLLPLPSERVFRREVKTHLCGSMKAKDPNVRQALVDRFGGKGAAIGTKRAPGPLYGVSGDVWAALAVAITYAETHALTQPSAPLALVGA